MRSPREGSPVRARVIARARRDAGLSVAEVADALGVRPLTVRRWESGVSSPQPQLVPRIAEVLRITPEVLLGSPVELTVLQARYRRGWTTEEAAARAGVSIHTWSRIERGFGSPLPERWEPDEPPSVVRVADVLGLDIEQVLPRDQGDFD